MNRPAPDSAPRATRGPVIFARMRTPPGSEPRERTSPPTWPPPPEAVSEAARPKTDRLRTGSGKLGAAPVNRHAAATHAGIRTAASVRLARRLPGGVRRLLHRAVHHIAHPRHATRQTRGHPVRPAIARPPLRAFRKAGTPVFLHRPAAHRIHVRREPHRRPRTALRAGARHASGRPHRSALIRVPSRFHPVCCSGSG